MVEYLVARDGVPLPRGPGLRLRARRRRAVSRRRERPPDVRVPVAVCTVRGLPLVYPACNLKHGRLPRGSGTASSGRHTPVTCEGGRCCSRSPSIRALDYRLTCPAAGRRTGARGLSADSQRRAGDPLPRSAPGCLQHDRQPRRTGPAPLRRRRTAGDRRSPKSRFGSEPTATSCRSRGRRSSTVTRASFRMTSLRLACERDWEMPYLIDAGGDRSGARTSAEAK